MTSSVVWRLGWGSTATTLGVVGKSIWTRDSSPRAAHCGEMKEVGFKRFGEGPKPVETGHEFSTPSKKIELYSARLAEKGFDAWSAVYRARAAAHRRVPVDSRAVAVAHFRPNGELACR